MFHNPQTKPLECRIGPNRTYFSDDLWGPEPGYSRTSPARRRRNILSFGDSGHEREALIKSTARHTQKNGFLVFFLVILWVGIIYWGSYEDWSRRQELDSLQHCRKSPIWFDDSMMFDKFPRFSSLMFPGELNLCWVWRFPSHVCLPEGVTHIVISGYYKSVEAVQQLEKTPMRSCSGCGWLVGFMKKKACE